MTRHFANGKQFIFVNISSNCIPTVAVTVHLDDSQLVIAQYNKQVYSMRRTSPETAVCAPVFQSHWELWQQTNTRVYCTDNIYHLSAHSVMQSIKSVRAMIRAAAW